jgi:prefoldin subunit 5
MELKSNLTYSLIRRMTMFLKMKLTIIAAVLISNADTIISFKANTVAKASEVNSNFTLIMSKLDSLKTMAAILKNADEKIAALEKKCDSTSTVISSLQSSLSRIDNVAKICDTFELKTKEIKDSLKQIGQLKNRYDTLDSKINTMNTNISNHTTTISTLRDTLSLCRNSIKITNDSLAVSERRNYLPIGTIIASMNAPNNDGYLVKADGTPDAKWVIAAGQADSIPDLRGVFLRGIDIIAAGKAATGRDSLNRKAGTFQIDIFGKHNHYQNTIDNTYGLMRRSKPGEENTKTATDAPGSGIEPDLGQIRELQDAGGLETRPKNVAVYYYIKVR